MIGGLRDVGGIRIGGRLLLPAAASRASSARAWRRVRRRTAALRCRAAACRSRTAFPSACRALGRRRRGTRGTIASSSSALVVGAGLRVGIGLAGGRNRRRRPSGRASARPRSAPAPSSEARDQPDPGRGCRVAPVALRLRLSASCRHSHLLRGRYAQQIQTVLQHLAGRRRSAPDARRAGSASSTRMGCSWYHVWKALRQFTQVLRDRVRLERHGRPFRPLPGNATARTSNACAGSSSSGPAWRQAVRPGRR